MLFTAIFTTDREENAIPKKNPIYARGKNKSNK